MLLYEDNNLAVSVGENTYLFCCIFLFGERSKNVRIGFFPFRELRRSHITLYKDCDGNLVKFTTFYQTRSVWLWKVIRLIGPDAMPCCQSVWRVNLLLQDGTLIGLCWLKGDSGVLKQCKVCGEMSKKPILPIQTILWYVFETFVFESKLTVYASVPQRVVYASVPLHKQTCHVSWAMTIAITSVAKMFWRVFTVKEGRLVDGYGA